MGSYGRIATMAWAILGAACNPQPALDSDFDGVPILPTTETSRDIGDYTLHFNAISTLDLAAEVASQYGIVRSQNNAILNLSIRRKLEDGSDTGARGDVEISATNLTGQIKPVTMREIVEEDAIYYIGEVGVTNAETLIFSIRVRPEGRAEDHLLRFRKQFFFD